MQNKTIKFFISSTFKDFIKERNALQNFVFLRLKKLCQKDGEDVVKYNYKNIYQISFVVHCFSEEIL